MKTRLLLLVALSALQALVAKADILHNFSYAATDGHGPQYGSLTLDGSSFYGMTAYGGSTGNGAIFALNTNGSGFSLLHSFSGGLGGKEPNGSLTLSGSTLYGMTAGGGSGGSGTIFTMGTGGSGYSVLHNFTGSASDGSAPQGSLILSGSTLYGVTKTGGSGYGTVFKMNTDGSGFGLLHSFAYNTDGANPFGSLTMIGSTLYGMTSQYGGSGKQGTLFKIDADGTDFSVIHRFAGGASDGSQPYGSLTTDGSTLYGMTYGGGGDSVGTVFEVDTSGGAFSVLHGFNYSTDGGGPQGDLTLVGSTLYGMTSFGGSSYNGTIFQMSTDGSDFQVHSFDGKPDGSTPKGSLTVIGSTLYGMTSSGGTGQGTVFAMATPVPEPSTWVLLLTAGSAASLWLRNRKNRRG